MPWWWLGRIIGIGRPLRVVRRVLIGLVAAYLLGTFLEVWWASTRDSHPQSQAIVVLGAAQYDGRPSPVLKARLDHALQLYAADVAPIVIVTGGRQPGDRVTEATASANYLIARGIDDADIRREVQGTNTWESLAAAARFLRRDGIRNVVLVSDAYHSARLEGTAREVGLRAHASPADRRAPIDRLVREAGAVALGRLIGYRRLTALVG